MRRQPAWLRDRFRIRVLERGAHAARLRHHRCLGAARHRRYTLDIDVLPRSFPRVAATPAGRRRQAGGATASLVLTLQGDRLDPATAEDPTNYTVTWLGPDGLCGTADDQVIPFADGPGRRLRPQHQRGRRQREDLPTAVRQTVTLLFADPLPAGSYRIDLTARLQTAAFNADELTCWPAAGLHGASGRRVDRRHDQRGQPADGRRPGVRRRRTGRLLRLQDRHPLPDAAARRPGRPARRHADGPGRRGRHHGRLLDQIPDRFAPSLGGAASGRGKRWSCGWTRPSLGVQDNTRQDALYDLGNDNLANNSEDWFFDVVGNIEVLVTTVDMGRRGRTVTR